MRKPRFMPEQREAGASLMELRGPQRVELGSAVCGELARPSGELSAGPEKSGLEGILGVTGHDGI